MAKYKRKKSEPIYRVKIAYDEITNRLNGMGIRWDGSCDLDEQGFGHAWIKTYRFDKKAQYIFICSHRDNMDPNCCEPIYRFIKVYNYTDDTKDDYIPGDIPWYASSSLEATELTLEELYAKLDAEYKTWQDNEYVYAAKYGILYQFIKDPENDGYCIPFTNYPWNVKPLDPEVTEFSPYNDWRAWPQVEIQQDNIQVLRSTLPPPPEPIESENLITEDNEDLTTESEEVLYTEEWSPVINDTDVDEVDDMAPMLSAMSAIVTEDNTLYVGNSHIDIQSIYIPVNKTDTYADVYTVSGSIQSYYKDPDGDDYRVCPFCLGKNKVYDTQLEKFGPCNRYGLLDRENRHYVEHNNAIREDASMFVVGKRVDDKIEIKPRAVKTYNLSSSMYNNEYIKEYPFWFKKIDDDGMFELHYNIYSNVNDDLNEHDTISDLLYSGTVIVKLTNPEETEKAHEKQIVTVNTEIGASRIEFKFVLPDLSEVSTVSELKKDERYIVEKSQALIQEDFTYITSEKYGLIKPFGIIKNTHVPYETVEDRKDIINKYVIIEPYLTINLSGWKYDGPEQIINYTTHNKSKTFDYPWNYDEIMNFVLFKDENLPIYATDKGLAYSHSHTFQYDGTPLQKLDKLKVWYGEIDNDDLDISDYTLNFDKDVDFPLADNLEDFKNHKNIYNYNPGYSAERHISTYTTVRDGLRSLPSYEGIFQYKFDQYDTVPNQYAWLKTDYFTYQDSNKQKIEKSLYTGMVDTYELHEDYINQFFQFRTTNPVHSIYYKEEFSAFNDLSAGSAMFMVEPTDGESEPVFSYNNDGTNKQAETYGCDKNMPYTLPGLKNNELRYRHICPSCSGMGVLGITKQSVSVDIPKTHNRIDERYRLSKDQDYPKPYRCPSCRGCGTQMRYVYLDHKLVTEGHVPVSVKNEDKCKEILYEVLDKKPIEYWYNATGVDSFESWQKQERWENYVYESLELTGFKADAEGRLYPNPGKIDTTKCYRWYNDIDDCVSYSAYDEAFGWRKIYFDKYWLKGQWNETKRWDNPCIAYAESWSIDDSDHLHHAHENKIYFKTVPAHERSNNADDFHNYQYRKNENLSSVCPQCNGTKKIINYLTNLDGSSMLDVMGDQRTEEITCTLCNGTGKITRNFYEGFNIVKCTHCENGKITCPKCKGTKIIIVDNKEVPCTNCLYDVDTKEYIDEPTGFILCPSCGGMLTVNDTYYMIAPDREIGKKVYRYNLKKAISSDNIMIEMDRIPKYYPEYIPGDNSEVNPSINKDDQLLGITKENDDYILMENGSVILMEKEFVPPEPEKGDYLSTEDAELLSTEDGELLVTEDFEIEPEPVPPTPGPEPELPPNTLRFRFSQSTTDPTGINNGGTWTRVAGSSYNDWDWHCEDTSWKEKFSEVFTEDNKVSIIAVNDNNVIYCNGMFNNCKGLISISENSFNNIIDCSYMFLNCSNLTSIGNNSFNSVLNGSCMFLSCSNLKNIPPNSFNNVINGEYMFYDCTSLTNIPENSFNNVDDASMMFQYCRSLTNIPDNSFNNVTNGNLMFYDCTSLVSIGDNSFNKVTNSNSMFYFCANVEQGALALYNKWLTTGTVTSHVDTFHNCGEDTTTGLVELKQIPKDWGGLLEDKPVPPEPEPEPEPMSEEMIDENGETLNT